MTRLISLSGRRDSNPRPSAWKADALPAELFPPNTYIGLHPPAEFSRTLGWLLVEGEGFEPS